MDRLDLFRSALERCRELLAEYPESRPMHSAVQQLEYLIAIATSQTADRSRLATVNLGVIAARDIEDRDMELAEMLYRVVEEMRGL